MKEVFGGMPCSRIALETGTHSPWVSRLLSELGHEVIVAHARNVRLIGESRRKDDRLDAKTLARLARIDPQLLSPVKHRSAKAQTHLTVIRARAGLVRARTALINVARGLTKSYRERLKGCNARNRRELNFVANRFISRNFFPLLFLHLCPGVFQCNRAVEDRRSRLRIEIGAEVSQALKLIAAGWCGRRQRRFQLHVRNHFE